jgi:threonine dehydratase
MTVIPTYDDILAAARAIDGAVEKTRQRKSQTLSRILGCEIFLKFENRQFTASFKERGALNKLLSLDDATRKTGVIAMSAGNHAQGVAYHANRLGIPATIVMPLSTPIVKVEHTKSHGANVVLHGENLQESAAHADKLSKDKGLCFVHPYDDPLVIAGQGTVALEILETLPHLDQLVVPIGGGGLISGMAIAAKQIKPDIKIIGVQTKLFPGMQDVLAGRPAQCGGSTIAEGIAVKEPGLLTRKITADLVDEIVLVREEELEAAICMIMNIEKTVVEGAGAAALAAVLSYPDKFKGAKIGLVLSGGNVDQRLLATVLMRDLVRTGRLTRLRLSLSDRAGQLADLSQIISDGGGNIVEVAHQRIFTHLPAKDTSIEVALETRDEIQLDEIVVALRAAGFQVEAM